MLMKASPRVAGAPDWMDDHAADVAFEQTVKHRVHHNRQGIQALASQAAMYGVLCAGDIRKAISHSNSYLGIGMAEFSLLGAMALAERAHQCWLGKCLLEARLAEHATTTSADPSDVFDEVWKRR